MKARLLIVEPDEEVMDSHLAFFRRTDEFEVEMSLEAEDCLQKFAIWPPHVLMLEPALPNGMAILDFAVVPVIILSRFRGADEIRSHPSVHEYYVKPKSLLEISARVRSLVASTT